MPSMPHRLVKAGHLCGRRSWALALGAAALVAAWASPSDAAPCQLLQGPFARTFPSTFARTGVFVDQLNIDTELTAGRLHFAATHFVGTQKIPRTLADRLRAENPNFIVLHYHLAVWQSGPDVPYLVDGEHWGNDYPVVDAHEDWFLHDAAGRRVVAPDHKLLMNVSNPE